MVIISYSFFTFLLIVKYKQILYVLYRTIITVKYINKLYTFKK